MTKTELSWLAGLLEGEGCFGIGKSHGMRPRIDLHMSDEDVVARACKLMGIGSYSKREGGQDRRPGKRTMFRAAIEGPRAVELMKKLSPLMGERRHAKIEEVLDACRT